MRSILTVLAVALVGSVAPIPANAGDGAYYRSILSSTVLIGETSEDPDSGALQASAGTPPAFAMVGDAFALPIIHSGGSGERSVVLTATPTGNLPGIEVVTSGLGGTFTVAGSYEFSVTVSDDEPSDTVTLGPWNMEVDPLLSVGPVDSIWTAATGTPSSFPLPAITGGLPGYTVTMVPSDPRVEILNGNVVVNATAAGSLGYFALKVEDQRPGRSRTSSPFEIVAETVVQAAIDDGATKIAAVTGGAFAKGASDRIAETAFRAGSILGLQAIQLWDGESLTVEYKALTIGNTVAVSFASNATNCTTGGPGGNAAWAFKAGHPRFLVSTSPDGVTWHDHLTYAAELNPIQYQGPQPKLVCSYAGSQRLDEGFKTFRFTRLTVVEAKRSSTIPAPVDIPVFRAVY